MAIRDLGLQHWPNQINQVKQLHSQILVRHGVMLVGPTGGGKTAVRTILQRALVLLPTIHLEASETQSGSHIIVSYRFYKVICFIIVDKTQFNSNS